MQNNSLSRLVYHLYDFILELFWVRRLDVSHDLNYGGDAILSHEIQVLSCSQIAEKEAWDYFIY